MKRDEYRKVSKSLEKIYCICLRMYYNVSYLTCLLGD